MLEKASNELSKMIFTKVKKEKIKKLFKTQIEDDVYLPLRASNIIKEIKNGNDLDRIPIAYFIESMFYILGSDEKFKYNNIYIKILKSKNEGIKYIKGKIFNLVKSNKYVDAYILIKGLLSVECSKDNFKKAFMLAEELRHEDNKFMDEEMNLIEDAKEFKDFDLPYLYEALILKDNNKYEDALFCINNYIAESGSKNPDILKLRNDLKLNSDFEEGKSFVYKDPDKALKILIPLVSKLEDKFWIFYYISIAYKSLQNFEKAIYYLNEAKSIDDNSIEVVNEFGINYASLGDFKRAIACFKKAFEVTKSVEICTNLIMCYLNVNDINEAKEYLKIAQKINPNDEIVVKLAKTINKN